MKGVVVAGIGTEVGKTLVSAILVESLKADYWKPVQAGGLEHTDTDRVRGLISSSDSCFHPEAYRLKSAMSPHAAAELDEVRIDLGRLVLPVSTQPVVVELAGGIMVPLNEEATNLDFICSLNLPVMLVVRYYLGCINHTLLSMAVLKANGVNVLGLVFNGEKNEQSKEVILKKTGLPVLLEIAEEASIHPTLILNYAAALQLEQ
jgi:dethiobiotin synthetase